MSHEQALREIESLRAALLDLRQVATVAQEENKALRLKVEKTERERDQLRMQVRELLPHIPHISKARCPPHLPTPSHDATSAL